MFTHMRPVKKHLHSAHGNEYELQVYFVEETSEYRIYISKENNGVGDYFSATDEIVRDAKITQSVNIIDGLIDIAKDDINRNEYGLY
jgi:hypothetical protein